MEPKELQKENKKNELAAASNVHSVDAGVGITPPPYQLKSDDSSAGEKEQSVHASANGLPGQLKAGVENYSQVSMDDVKVEFNSSAPAQLQAHSYAQGNEIKIGPGREQDLPHEAWHVAQQKQGRVQPTTQMKSFQINNDESLEKEADMMGAKSASFSGEFADKTVQNHTSADGVMQQKSKPKSVKLPEKLGPAQEGDIANKGEGDDHAFSKNDVNQGSIGDCYFLASLMAVAQMNPGLLEKAITKQDEKTYRVRLYKKKSSGILFWKKEKLVPQDIILYPTFPVEAAGNDDANENASTLDPHAHGGDQNSKGQTELWVRLIEKAYAILNGSYKNISGGGWPDDALEALTGKEHSRELVSGSFKDQLVEAMENNVPTTVWTNKAKFENMSDSLEQFADENDIVGGHAYSVVSANDSKIKVRNPWGQNAANAEPEMTWAQFESLFNQYSKLDE